MKRSEIVTPILGMFRLLVDRFQSDTTPKVRSARVVINNLVKALLAGIMMSKDMKADMSEAEKAIIRDASIPPLYKVLHLMAGMATGGLDAIEGDDAEAFDEILLGMRERINTFLGERGKS